MMTSYSSMASCCAQLAFVALALASCLSQSYAQITVSNFIEYLPSAVGKRCSEVCKKGGSSSINLKSLSLITEDFLCGRVRQDPAGTGKKHMLLGTGTAMTAADGKQQKGEDCTIYDYLGTGLTTVYKPGDYFCACDRVYPGTAAFRWIVLLGCPAERRPPLTLPCAASFPGPGGTYSLGYMVKVGDSSRCATPAGLSTDFLVVYCMSF